MAKLSMNVTTSFYGNVATDIAAAKSAGFGGIELQSPKLYRYLELLPKSWTEKSELLLGSIFMRTRSTLTEGQRERLVDLFEAGMGTRAAASQLNVRYYATEKLYDRWRLHGRLCLMEKPTKTVYSFEVKKEVVDRYLAGETSMDLAAEFHISSKDLVKTWARTWRQGGDEALMPKPKGRPKDAAQTEPLSEEEKLRRENKRLLAEVAYLKKIAGLEGSGASLKTKAIVTLKSEHDLADLLAAAGLARSTYYYHLKLMDQADPYAELKAAITTSFENSKRRYGYRKVHMDLRAEGWNVSRKLVRKLMRILGFQSKARPKRRYNSYQGEQSKIAENLLQRHFDVEAPDTVYVSDVTEFRVDQRKLYLSPIMDLFDHSILSYTIASSPTTAFTRESLALALGSRDFNTKLLVHTDQGFQYQHQSWKRLLEEHGAVQSMSRKGNRFDNSVMENFFGHLKSEMFHGEHFADFAELKVEIEAYIDWYNVSRRQERLKGMTPMEYRCHTLAA